MEKKSDIISELKKEIAKNEPKSDSKKEKEQESNKDPKTDIKQESKEEQKHEIKQEQKKEEKQDTPNSAESIFDSRKHEEDKLLKQKRNLRRLSMFILFGSLILVLVVFFIINYSGQNQKLNESSLAAKVNNKYITLNEVAQWQNFLEMQQQNLPRTTTLKDEDVLKQLIAYELLVSQAQKEGIIVSDVEINALYDQYNRLAQYSLEKILDAQNITVNDFRTYLKQTLLIQKLFDKVITTPQISEKDIDNFIDNNKDFIARQTLGKNLTTQDIRDSVKLTLIDLKKEEMKNSYIQNLLDSADIKYYNKFEAIFAK